MNEKPKYTQTSIKQEVVKVDGNKPFYYPVYEFTGKNFMKRDIPGKKPS